MNFLSNINFIVMETQSIYLEIGTECLYIIWINFISHCVSAYWVRGNFFRCLIESFILATPYFEEVHRRIYTLKSM